jgi:hypothetical protein
MNINKYVCKQIESLVALIGDNCGENETPVIMAMSCLATASYLLSENKQAEPERKPVNLIEQWSGPLPSAPPNGEPKKSRSKKPKITVDSHGRSGGEFGQYEFFKDVSSTTMCSTCQAPIGEQGAHPEDKNCPMENGKYPVIACDGSRVYIL